MNKALLRKALKFKNGANPTYSQIEDLYKEVIAFQKEHGVIFMYAKYRKKSEIYDLDKFFEFLSEIALDGKTIKCFEDIENALNSSTREIGRAHV
mgnify:CR=1 FL=1